LFKSCFLLIFFIFKGTVVKCPDPRHAVIQFEGKEERNVPTRLVIAMSGAIPWPMLRVYIYSKFTYNSMSWVWTFNNSTFENKKN
jgi:hypothetical protein